MWAAEAVVVEAVACTEAIAGAVAVGGCVVSNLFLCVAAGVILGLVFGFAISYYLDNK